MSIDLTNVDTESAFHSVMKSQLAFPEWYGEKWDAFGDTIIGLVEMPEELILENCQGFERACPKDMQILREIIEQYNEEIPDKEILLG